MCASPSQPSSPKSKRPSKIRFSDPGLPKRSKDQGPQSGASPKFSHQHDPLLKQSTSCILPPKKFGPRPELTIKQKLELKKAFGTFDPRGRGLIETRGFILALRAMTYEPKFEEVQDLIAKVLGPEDRKIMDFKDFYKLMTAKMIGKDSKEDNLKAFRMFSDPATGVITLENLMSIAHELEADISKEELQEMITFADTNKNGVVEFEEFNRILKRPKLE